MAPNLNKLSLPAKEAPLFMDLWTQVFF